MNLTNRSSKKIIEYANLVLRGSILDELIFRCRMFLGD